MSAHATFAAQGVGLALHPLLLDVLKQGRLTADFFEAALEAHLAPAFADLGDPGEQRLRELAQTRPIVWRSSAFSLGSVEDARDPAPDAALLRRVAQLSQSAGATGLIETIGFRRLGPRDLGRAQRLPMTTASADWTAARAAALRAALGLPVALQLAHAGERPAGELDLASFLSRIAERSGCDLALDVADLAGEDLSRFSDLPITALAISDEATDGAALDEVLTHLAPRALIVRRTRQLYPIDDIAALIGRAGAALSRRAPGSTAPSPIPAGGASVEAALALQAWQIDRLDRAFALKEIDSPAAARLATEALAWNVWRQRVEETWKGQQIKQFLSAESYRVH